MKLNVGNTGLKQATNVLNLKVPQHMRERTSLGIDWLNELFGTNPEGKKGAVPSQSVLYTGTPGAGKTTLLLQIADQVTKAGGIALFNTCEESIYQVKMTTERLRQEHGFIIGDDDLIPSVATLEPHVKKARKGARSVIDHAKMLLDANPTKNLVLLLDSLQTFDDGKYADAARTGATPLHVIEQVTDFCKSGHNGRFPVAITIGQVGKDGKFLGKNGIKHAVDAHMHLFIDEDKKSETYGERIIEMQKNRFGCSGKKMLLGMTERGLTYKGEWSYSES